MKFSENLYTGCGTVLADLNLAPSALSWWEKGGVSIIGKEVVFLLGLVAAICWWTEERALAVEAYFSNGRTKSQKHWLVHNAEASNEVLVGYLHSNSACFAYWRNRKWASSLKNMIASGGTSSRSDSKAVWLPLKSRLVSCCSTAILYRWTRSSSWRIRLTVRSEIPRAASCLWAECLGVLTLFAGPLCFFSDYHWP